MSKVRGYLLLTLIFVLLAAGCTPEVAIPSPTPLPTATMTLTRTPTPLPNPTACSSVILNPRRTSSLEHFPGDSYSNVHQSVEGFRRLTRGWERYRGDR